MEHWLSLGFVRETEQLVELGRVAERCGFAGVAVADRFASPTRIDTRYPYTPDGKVFWPGDLPWPDPWVTLGAVAGATQRIKLVSNVYIMPLRNAFVAAREIATTAVLSDNRVRCGVGAGWMKEEYDLAGVDFATRGARLNEMIEVMRKLWSGEPVVHEGTHFEFPEVQLHPSPSKPIPIWGGGVSKAALRRVAKMCDGWMGLVYTPERLWPVLDQLATFAREEGRSLDELDVLIGLGVKPTADVLEELEGRGVTGVITTPWFRTKQDTSSIEAKREIIERYAERYIC